MGVHGVVSIWPGDVASAEQGHSCQPHSSLPVDKEQPWAAQGHCVGGSACRQHWVNKLVWAGAGQPSRHSLCRQAVGSAGSARSCRLVEAC